MKKSLIAGLIALTASPALFAANYKIEIQNLTRGIYFTPLLVSAHAASSKLFISGMPSSSNLQKMAEGGDISGLAVDITNAGGKSVENPAAGLLAPGAMAMADLGDPGATNTQLSVVAMMLPTNDGFIALNNMTLPTAKGTYTYMLNAYDAGTEANNELRGSGAPGMAGMPVPPPLESLVGTGGTGVPGVTAEGFIHIHRGSLGDMNNTGGTSDINAANQRWLNPVARVTVTVE
jgi:hypothetical protein